MDSRWDAKTYDLVSTVQESWGLKVLEQRRWHGNEIILDAGCGTGRLALHLSSRAPKGMVYAVDIDPEMVRYARKKLDKLNVDVIHGDIQTLNNLPQEVDVIFSNAVLHWIPDHRKVFENFWRILNSGGQMLIQCGGYENLRKIHSVLDMVRCSRQFSNYFKKWKEPWYFAKKHDTEILLKEAGFCDFNVYLSPSPVIFSDKEKFSLYLKTVIMKPYLAYLPDSGTKNSFLQSALDRISNNTQKLELDYVRLNIIANK